MGEVTWPVIATRGTLSSMASARPVTRLVAPGPDVAMHTPTLPVHLAKPSAAKISPCRPRHVSVIQATNTQAKEWWGSRGNDTDLLVAAQNIVDCR